MAKYDWKQLEKEYILSDFKSVSQFIKNKKIPYNGTTKAKTKGWTEKKRLKQDQKETKIIEKVIEKESEKEANKIIQIKDVANELLSKVVQANNELNMHIAIKSYVDIIDRQGLKMLTSALKDLNEILTDKQSNNETDLNNAKEVLIKIKEVANDG